MRSFVFGSLFAALCFCEPVQAQTAIGGFTVTGEVAAVSDYRFRGISYSNREAVIQPQVTVSHKSGLYGNVFVSTLPRTDALGNVELDFAGGWTHAVGKSGSLDVGGAYYTYPNRAASAPVIDYGEIYARYSHAMGAMTGTIGAAYAPKQESQAKRENFNLSGDLRYDVTKTPLALNAHVGRTAGYWAPGNVYHDWSIGATASLDRLRVGLAYVDTDVPDLAIAKPTAVASVRIIF